MTFTCVVTSNGDKLYWEVDYANSSYSNVSRQRYVYFTTDQQGRAISVTNNVEHTFEFTLTSNSPLTSTATTTVSNQLSGTQILCVDQALSHAASVVRVITGKSIATIMCTCVHVSPRTKTFLGPISIDSILMFDTVPHESMVVVHVSVSASIIGADHKFFITLTPPVESGPSNFMTQNTTIQLSVLYNYEYTMNVVANNCAGNSTPVSTTFNISKLYI